MNGLSLTGILIIVSGTAVMAASIMLFREIICTLSEISSEAYDRLSPYFYVHQLLLVCFIAGVLFAGYGIVSGIEFINTVFMAILFLTGMLFGLAGMWLQKKTIQSVRHLYNQAVESGNDLKANQVSLLKKDRKRSVEINEQKKAVGLAEESEVFLRKILDALPVPLMVVNPDHTIALSNPEFYKITGKNPANTGEKCFAFSHGRNTPCDGTRHPCPIKEVVKTRNRITVEHVHMDADGVRQHVEILAAPVFSEKGELLHIVETIRDTTAPRKKENQPLESEEKYSRMVESVPDATPIPERAQGRFLQSNQSVTKTTGHTTSADEKKASPQNRSIKALLADDSQTSLEVAQAFLKKLGCRVDTATDGQKVVDMMNRHGYDVVFMDIHMPLMDGYKATRIIRKMKDKNRKVPIVALTTRTLSGDRQKCIDAGMNDYVTKPLHFRELSEALERVLPPLPHAENKIEPQG